MSAKLHPWRLRTPFNDLTYKKKRWANVKFRNKGTGEVFDDLYQAADKYNVSRSAISCAIHEGYRCAGFYWERIDSDS